MMSKCQNPKPIIIFRWISVASLVVALIMRVVGRRVIYIEPIGVLRSSQWVERLSRWGVEWVDYHDYAEYLPNSDLVIAGQYAAVLMEKAFGPAELNVFSKTIPGLRDHEQRVHTLVFNYLSSTLDTHAQAYALADYFQTRGYRADIFQPRASVEVFLEEHEICAAKNLFPKWGVSYLLRGLNMSLRGQIRHGLWARVKSQLKVRKIEAKIEHPDEPLHEPATVLYFPHKGVSYGPLFVKDQYYSNNLESPFHPARIQHIELGWMLSDKERSEIQADYDGRGITVTFAELPKQSLAEKIRIVLRRFYQSPGGAVAITRAFMLGQLELRLKSCRQAFTRFEGAKVALLGHDTLFPGVATVALQSYGIRVMAVQERFISAYHTFYAPLLDTYCVHGKVVKKALEKNQHAAVDEIVVTGDPRAEKISNRFKNAALERNQAFGAFSQVCLVLDFHSTVDPFKNALLYGPDWKSNRFFYEAIITLAQSNLDCAFIIRGKDVAWQNVPALEAVNQTINTLNNIFVDNQYGRFDRSYELAAMADLVIARYTSLCDQCLAQGIPVLVFEGTPNGGNVISRWHDYESYPVIIRELRELQNRFEKIIRNGVYMPDDQFRTMRREYYAKDSGDANNLAHTRLQQTLDNIYNRSLNHG